MHETSGRRRIGEVEGHTGDPVDVGETGGGQRAADHVGALGGEGAGDGETDALAGAGDDGDLVVQQQIHRGFLSRGVGRVGRRRPPPTPTGAAPAEDAEVSRSPGGLDDEVDDRRMRHGDRVRTVDLDGGRAGVLGPSPARRPPGWCGPAWRPCTTTGSSSTPARPRGRRGSPGRPDVGWRPAWPRCRWAGRRRRRRGSRSGLMSPSALGVPSGLVYGRMVSVAGPSRLPGAEDARPPTVSSVSGAKAAMYTSARMFGVADGGVGHHHPAVRVADEHDRAGDRREEVAEVLRVDGQSAQRVGRGDHRVPLALQLLDDTAPAGCVGERAVDEDDRRLRAAAVAALGDWRRRGSRRDRA